ncbi:hypothetical protein HG535_0H00720 [Zygotorulaspora mrakii]|uniref:L-type lectin-like domain-containing protein n=1 Tax=Zygotorulaspora mrakii TaxID=42260 RepID=A0A7H9B819_ZYGMR|nr:uncharacterized protein HG535_0H00720 [Zygotorulaspora mrakii]QLG74747.1 hypothetical protein HG535_0H00720 [Zygotorulaspora mrakii]
MRKGTSLKLLISVVVTLLFITFNFGARYFANSSTRTHSDSDKSHIVKIPNREASLSVPYLEAINRFWHVGGSTEIRNTELIRLTKKGKTNDHGIVISNGIGDNTMNNLEIIVEFRISPTNGRVIDSRKQHVMGDGMAIVITPDKDFITQDLHSSYARKQYELNSGGIFAGNTEMMGFPANLPGMALIIDTYQNLPHSRKITPFMDAILNVSPSTQSYDIDSDGIYTSARKLNDKDLRLKQSIIRGDQTRLRIIYLESIKFLKVDIQYDQEGSFWIELFQQEDIIIPKNPKNGQRFIGIGALTGDYSETVDIFDISTSEFHWKDIDETNEDSLLFAKEIDKYFIAEYEDRVALERDDFQKWKMLKSQPKYLKIGKNTTEALKTKKISFVSILIVFCILSTIIYVASVYIRVSLKHAKRLKRNILP